MRQVATLTILAMTALTLTACATMNVSSHVLRSADFTQYRTFDWGPADALPTGDPRLDRDPFFQDHVQGALEKGFAGKGFERVSTGTPDLLIHYHANISRRIDINWIDRERGYCYGDDCPVRTVEAEAGTLVVDVIDARTNRLVWRGCTGITGQDGSYLAEYLLGRATRSGGSSAARPTPRSRHRRATSSRTCSSRRATCWTGRA